jgi:hypothetical protein
MPNIPVYIISFNQPTYLRNMIRQLRGLQVAPEEIHVVDNASTSGPLRAYLTELESQGYSVHRMARNFGPYVVFDPDAALTLPSVFALTDPDLQFDSRMPSSFRADLAEIARRCGSWKGGCALALREADKFVPGPYFQGQTIRDWESAFWCDATPGVNADLGGDPVYRAALDTTFAVYRRDIHSDDFFDAVRVAGRYEARHLPWYAESFALPSGPGAGTGEPIRFDDGRIMVRPGPCEVAHYRREAKGSTTAALMPIALAEDYLEVSRPEDDSTFAVAPWTPHAAWWTEHFAAGWQAATFRILRKTLISPRGPTRLIDLGASIGEIALWSALHCEHVFCVEADDVALRELRENIAINRFQHCISVVPAALAPECGEPGRADREHAVSRLTLDALCRQHGIPLESGRLVIKCDLGGGEEGVLGDLLAFAVAHHPVVDTLLVALDPPRWRDPSALARILDEAYARHPMLHRWQLHSEHLEPLAGVADVLDYLDEVPRGALLWTGPS